MEPTTERSPTRWAREGAGGRVGMCASGPGRVGGAGGRFKWLEPEKHLPRPGGSRAASSLVSVQAGTKREFLLQDWGLLGVTAFGGYTRPAKAAHRGGGSPHLEGRTALHGPPHIGKPRPQLVAPPMSGLSTPRHAVTHPPVAGAPQHAHQLQLRGRRGARRRGRDARRRRLLLREAGPEGGNHPSGRQEAPPPTWPRPAVSFEAVPPPTCDAVRRPTRLQPLPCLGRRTREGHVTLRGPVT